MRKQKPGKNPEVAIIQDDRVTVNHVPSFLAYLLEDTIPDEVFFTAYTVEAEKNSAPLWWLRDVPVGLSKKDRKKEIKRQHAINEYLSYQNEQKRRQYRQYLVKEETEEAAFHKRLQENESLLALKMKEIELIAAENTENLKRELSLREARLKEALREKKDAELQLKNEEQIRKKQLLSLGQLEEIQWKIAYTEREIREAEETKDALTLKKQALHAENIRRAEENNLPEADAVPVRAFLAKRYEEYDPENIIEIRDLYFKRKEEDNLLRDGVTLAVKRNTTTVIFSEMPEKTEYMKQILFRNYGSDLHIIQGIVRIDGRETGKVPKSEYKDTFGKYIVGLDDTIAQMSKARTSAKSLTKGLVREEPFKFFLKYFDIAGKPENIRLSKLDGDELSALALAAVLASPKAVKLLENAEAMLSEKAYEKLLAYLNSPGCTDTVIVTAFTLKAVSKYQKAKVYTL